MTPKNSITQADLARSLGVSPQAVSFALTGTGRLSEKTRRKILSEAEKAGYRPNVAAQAMARGKFDRIGVLLGSDSPSYLPPEMLFSAEKVCVENGFGISLSRVPDEKLLSEGERPGVLKSLSVDGLLIHYSWGRDETINALLKPTPLPTVWLNTKLARNAVYFDDVKAGCDAASTLRALGHRRILFAVLGPNRHYSVDDRIAGYCKVMDDSGLRSDVIREVNAKGIEDSDSGEYARDIFTRLLGRKNRPSAVIAYGLPEVSALLLAAAELGLKIPGDLSVIAFGDSGRATMGRPLSVMKTPMGEIGHAGSRMLFDILGGEKKELPAVKLEVMQPLPGSIGICK